MFPEMKSILFLASCAEMITEFNFVDFSSLPKTDEDLKEHVLVTVKIKLQNRDGVIILDPGYHVGVPVIVMADEQYPHTGWFVQSETKKSRKEYCYTLHQNLKYVNWAVRETRSGKTEMWENLVYVGSKYLAHVSVSEKRNLVYNFRTLVVRDGNQPVAGLYCVLGVNARCTIFYRDILGERAECKIPLDYFVCSQLNLEYEHALVACTDQLKCNISYLKTLLKKVAEANLDDNFMPVVLKINSKLEE
ncbi:uncharacterized protein LOC143223078 [Tachypleus tridentatus]|uniref:uncharacterized protein LOC143223078 n=1 Tax=Tachypleus tridentatus TaxID=6853 RepID=UPI003FD4F6AC